MKKYILLFVIIVFLISIGFYFIKDSDTISIPDREISTINDSAIGNPSDRESDIRYKYRDKYDAIWNFSWWLAIVLKWGKYWFIDEGWKVVIPLIYDYLKEFSEGLAVASKDWKYGFINEKWEELMPFQYEYANSFSENRASVTLKNWKWESQTFFIDPKWYKQWISFNSILTAFSGWKAYVMAHNWVRWIDIDGKPLDQGIWMWWWNSIESTPEEHDGVIRWGRGSSTQFWKRVGKEWVWISSPKEWPYEAIWDFSWWLAPVKRWLIQFIDKNGKVIINNGYWVLKQNYEEWVLDENNWYLRFTEDKMPVLVGPKISYINSKWEVIFSLNENIEYAEHFKNGYAWIKENWKWGCIDQYGNNIIPPQYDSIDCSHEQVKVQENKKYWFINKQGKILVPIIYDEIGEFSEWLVRVKKDKLYGYMDTNGNIVIKLQFPETTTNPVDFHNGIALIKHQDDSDLWWVTNNSNIAGDKVEFLYPDWKLFKITK